MNDKVNIALKRVYKRYLPELSDNEDFKELFEKFFVKIYHDQEYGAEFILVEKYIVDNFDYDTAWRRCLFQEFKPSEWQNEYWKLILKHSKYQKYVRKDLVKEYKKYVIKLACWSPFSKVINTLGHKINALKQKGTDHIYSLQRHIWRLRELGKTDTLEYKKLSEELSRFNICPRQRLVLFLEI